MEHEASTSKIGDEQLFYCQTRGITPEDATNMIVNGFCKQVFLKLPMEFAVEAETLISVSLNLEGTVGGTRLRWREGTTMRELKNLPVRVGGKEIGKRLVHTIGH